MQSPSARDTGLLIFKGNGLEIMNITTAQLIGMIVSVLGIAGLAIYSGTKPQTFANVNGSPIIAGIIMGTLVGGSSTVGTAQLAYNYGMSAWWFTLGGGIGCLILALLYIKPMRNSGCMTLVGMISKEYGPRAGLAASLLSSAGTFINIISQLIAGTAVIAVVAPTLGIVPALIITAAFMTLYVVPVMYDILYRRVPREVDLGDESIDDDPGDAQAYLEALQNARALAGAKPGVANAGSGVSTGTTS